MTTNPPPMLLLPAGRHVLCEIAGPARIVMYRVRVEPNRCAPHIIVKVDDQTLTQLYAGTGCTTTYQFPMPFVIAEGQRATMYAELNVQTEIGGQFFVVQPAEDLPEPDAVVVR